MDLKELEAGVEPSAHWYYRSKARLMRRTLAASVLDASGSIWDVGAGSGFFSAYLLANASLGSAVCIDPNYQETAVRSINGKPLSFVRSVEGIDASPALVLMMDVLEHVPDPVELCTSYAKAVSSGCTFFVTVPAHSWLWSSHDVFLGHRERYSLSLLAEHLGAAGLVLDQGGYHFLSILPFVAAVRLAERVRSVPTPTRSNLRSTSRWANSSLERLLRWERHTLGLNPIAGVSVVAVARKP